MSFDPGNPNPMSSRELSFRDRSQPTEQLSGFNDRNASLVKLLTLSRNPQPKVDLGVEQEVLSVQSDVEIEATRGLVSDRDTLGEFYFYLVDLIDDTFTAEDSTSSLEDEEEMPRAELQRYAKAVEVSQEPLKAAFEVQTSSSGEVYNQERYQVFVAALCDLIGADAVIELAESDPETLRAVFEHMIFGGGEGDARYADLPELENFVDEEGVKRLQNVGVLGRVQTELDVPYLNWSPMSKETFYEKVKDAGFTKSEASQLWQFRELECFDDYAEDLVSVSKLTRSQQQKDFVKLALKASPKEALSQLINTNNFESFRLLLTEKQWFQDLTPDQQMKLVGILLKTKLNNQEMRHVLNLIDRLSVEVFLNAQNPEDVTDLLQTYAQAVNLAQISPKDTIFFTLPIDEIKDKWMNDFQSLLPEQTFDLESGLLVPSIDNWVPEASMDTSMSADQAKAILQSVLSGEVNFSELLQNSDDPRAELIKILMAVNAHVHDVFEFLDSKPEDFFEKLLKAQISTGGDSHAGMKFSAKQLEEFASEDLIYLFAHEFFHNIAYQKSQALHESRSSIHGFASLDEFMADLMPLAVLQSLGHRLTPESDDEKAYVVRGEHVFAEELLGNDLFEVLGQEGVNTINWAEVTDRAIQLTLEVAREVEGASIEPSPVPKQLASELSTVLSEMEATNAQLQEVNTRLSMFVPLKLDDDGNVISLPELTEEQDKEKNQLENQQETLTNELNQLREQYAQLYAQLPKTQHVVTDSNEFLRRLFGGEPTKALVDVQDAEPDSMFWTPPSQEFLRSLFTSI